MIGMIGLLIRRWRERKLRLLREELEFIKTRVNAINTLMTSLSAQSEDFCKNCRLLGQLEIKKLNIERRLQRYATA